MKFKFGDTVIYKDEFADYTGLIVAHTHIRSWHNLWRKESWYEINLVEINGKPARGNAVFPEKVLKKPEDKLDNTNKVTKLDPRKRK